jgi:hypothetical protein
MKLNCTKIDRYGNIFSLKPIGYLLFLIVLLNVFAITINTAHAYYHPGARAEKIPLLRERNSFGGNKPEGNFFLYDNADCPSRENISYPIITVGSKNFVPADVIDCNIPVRIAISHPIVAENDLANLLYADLKLKKLYDEYKSLQKRTREILAGLSVPFISQSETNNPKPSREPSVHSKKEEIVRENEIAIRYIPLSSSRLQPIDITSPSDADPLTSLFIGRQQSELPTITRSGQQTLDETGKEDVSGSSVSEQQTEKTPPSDNALQKKNKSLISDKEGVPWIFRIFMKFQDYMFSNPREVIITMLIFALIISFLLSARRR